MLRTFSLAALGKKIAWSTLVQLGGKVLQIVLAAVSMKLISNYLTNGDYGVYATIGEFALFFSVVANLGIFGQTVRAMSEAPHDGKLFFNALVLRVVTALLIFGGGVLYLVASGASGVFLMGTTLFLGALFFDYVTSVCDGMLQANYLMGRATVALVAGRIVSVVGVLWVIRLAGEQGAAATAGSATAASIPLLFVASLAGAFVAAGLSLFFVWQKIDRSWRLDGALIKNILLLSLPFGIINILNSLYFRFVPELLARQAMDDKSFATFTISFKIAQVLSLFSTFLMFSVLPGFRQYLHEKNWGKVKQVYKTLLKLLATCGALLVIVGPLIGPWALEFLTHKKYFLPELWFLLPMMLLLAAISYGYDLILITLFAMKQDFWLIRREVMALALGGLFFGASFWIDDMSAKIVVVLVGALSAELFMVVAGTTKIRRFFAKHIEGNL